MKGKESKELLNLSFLGRIRTLERDNGGVKLSI
jgi:hypothetical protein